MPDYARLLQVEKQESTLLALFIPSADRKGKTLGKKEQDRWVAEALKVLGTHFGGATAFPRGMGVWRDDERHGLLVWDKPVIIQCYTSEEALEASIVSLREFLVQMGRKTRQGAVGLVIDRAFLEIRFPLEE